MKPEEIIKYHEDQNHGIIHSRCWSMLKEYLKNNGKFPEREEFREIIKPMYQKDGKLKRIRKIICLSSWRRIINPIIKK